MYNLLAQLTGVRGARRGNNEGARVISTFFSRRYSRQGLWSLFLICALPLHVWTMILAFRDMSWVAERTNTWDAVGVFSYGLVFALAESLLLFLVFALLGFLISAHWDPQWRVSALAVLVLMLSLWAIIEQLFYLLVLPVPGFIIDFLVHSGHPLRTLYAGVFALLALTIAAPVILVLRSRKAAAFVQAAIDRLSLLVMFYLLFDAVGLVIVVIRNL